MTSIETTSPDRRPSRQGPASVVVCLACRLSGTAVGSATEAEFLAGVHDGLHHAARPTALAALLTGTVAVSPTDYGEVLDGAA